MIQNDFVDNGWICERRDVSELVFVISCNFAKDPAHDFAGTCLRKTRAELKGEKPILLSDTVGQLRECSSSSNCKGENTGLGLVMGGDSCSRSRGFEFEHEKLD